jgi:hypothetical protein
MSELTNLTDRLAHLRERKGGSPAITGNEPEQQPSRPSKKAPKSPSKALPERRFANDYFMFFAYALLTVAILTQFALIASLDIL